MNNIIYNNRQIELDEDGFLVNPDDWDEDIALVLANRDSVFELNEEHFLVIEYLRKYYKDFGIAPLIRRLCQDNNFTLKQIYKLFPNGPANGACKIAGLPKPSGCV